MNDEEGCNYYAYEDCKKMGKWKNNEHKCNSCKKHQKSTYVICKEMTLSSKSLNQILRKTRKPK